MQRVTVAFILLGLLAPAAAPPASAQDKSSLSPAQKDEVKKLVREYLLENPQVISEAIDALQAKEDKDKADKQAAVIANRKQEIFNPSEGTVIGNAKGDVTLVEFFDYNCGYCKKMYQAMGEVLQEDKKLRVVLKEYPILGPSSVTAARAALASVKQGKYAAFHMALLSHKGSLNDGAIQEIAKGVGLDVKKLQEDMKAPEISTVIARNRDLAQALSISGTPALIIGKEFVPGAIDKEHLLELIATARK